MAVEESIDKLNQTAIANHAGSDKICQDLIEILTIRVTKQEHTETELGKQ